MASQLAVIARTRLMMIDHLVEYRIVITRAIRVQVFVSFQDATSLLILIKHCVQLDLLWLLLRDELVV